jgi:hypothetical protein
MAELARRLKKRLELAGVPTPLEQATVPKEWLVPEIIELRGARVCWRPTKPSPTLLGQRCAYSTRAPGSGLLERFVALADASPEDILRYARHWGVLAICAHGLPASHNLACTPLELRSRRGVVFWEPVQSWRFFSRHAKAILEIAAATHTSQVVESAPAQLLCRPPRPNGQVAPFRVARTQRAERIDLEKLLGVLNDCKHLWEDPFDVIGGYLSSAGSPGSSRKANALVRQRALVTFAVNSWLDWGRARPHVVWNSPTPTIELTTGGLLEADRLLGALALQLAYAVARSEGVATCFACGRFYTPRRRPAARRRSFCPDCGLRAAWRTSKRAIRAAAKQRQD